MSDQFQLTTELAASAVTSLFNDMPTKDGEILYLGNTKQLIEAVEQYFENHRISMPTGMAVELDKDRLDKLRGKYENVGIKVLSLDFLTADLGEFEYVLGCPPNITAGEFIGKMNMDSYKEEFRSAKGNFNIGSLQLEQSLDHLAENGRLTMILPSQFVKVKSDRPLRRYLATEYHVEELNEIALESTSLLIMTIVNSNPGETKTPAGTYHLSDHGDDWLRAIRGIEPPNHSNIELQKICRRISKGVVTGADDVFVVDSDEVPPQIQSDWIYPTVCGDDLETYDEVKSNRRIICPYTRNGCLALEDELGEGFIQWAELHRRRLKNRAGMNFQGESWYGWAQPPQIDDLLHPKILTPGFTDDVKFWLDDSGEYIPRQTVCYITPKNHVDLNSLLDYLNSQEVLKWIETTSREMNMCKLRTRYLEKLPIPESFTMPHSG